METELKNEIQNKVKNILTETIFLENTSETREEIKTKIDEYLTELANEYKIYNFFTKVTENEGIDVYIEPEKEKGVYVNHYDIVKTGTIEDGGFNIF